MLFTPSYFSTLLIFKFDFPPSSWLQSQVETTIMTTKTRTKILGGWWYFLIFFCSDICMMPLFIKLLTFSDHWLTSIVGTGSWDSSFQLKYFTDSTFSTEVTEDSAETYHAKLGQEIYVQSTWSLDFASLRYYISSCRVKVSYKFNINYNFSCEYYVAQCLY